MDQEGAMRPEILSSLFQNGLMGMEIPAEYGGSEMNFTSACIAVEEVRNFGRENQKERGLIQRNRFITPPPHTKPPPPHTLDRCRRPLLRDPRRHPEHPHQQRRPFLGFSDPQGPLAPPPCHRHSFQFLPLRGRLRFRRLRNEDHRPPFLRRQHVHHKR